MPPLHNRPKITRTDVDRGYVMRYFVQNVSTKSIVEVDPTQYGVYLGDPYYYCIQLQWSVGGNDITTSLASGVSITGTRERNLVVVDFYNRKMPGLRNHLRNPLEYFSGTRISEQKRFVAPATPAPPLPPPPEPEPVPDPTFERLTLGRLAAHASTDTLVSDVNTAFVVDDWAGFSSTAATVTPSITADANAGELQVEVGSAAATVLRGVRYTPIETGRDVFLIVRTRSVAFNVGLGGVAARLPVSGADEMLVGRRGYVNSAANSQFALVETFAAGTLQSISEVASDERTPGVVGLWARDTLANGRSVGPNRDHSLSLTGLSSSLEGTRAGIFASRGSTFGSNTLRFSAWAAMRSALIRVTGTDTGTWQVRLRDAGGTLIYTSASHTAGVVEINTLTEMTVLYPAGIPVMAQIEIYDPVAEEVLMGPVIPTERIWGGDVWQYSA